jgi:hypothetical protein
MSSCGDHNHSGFSSEFWPIQHLSSRVHLHQLESRSHGDKFKFVLQFNKTPWDPVCDGVFGNVDNKPSTTSSMRVLDPLEGGLHNALPTLTKLSDSSELYIVHALRKLGDTVLAF